MEELKEKVDSLNGSDDATSEEIAAATKALHGALGEEELYLSQKSRIFWLLEGDRNSSFFHASTKQRRARNRISKLIDDRGKIAESQDDLVAVATKYFRDLFEIQTPPR